jgi:DNA gyrase subunit A
MKLAGTDLIDKVYYLSGMDNAIIDDDGKSVDLNAIRVNKRDGKGSKVK